MKDIIDKQTGEVLLPGTQPRNVNFVQWDRRSMAAFRGLTSKNPLASEMLIWMAEKMGRDNALVCSYDTLMSITGKSRPTVARALKVLKDDSWVQAIRLGSATAWVINSAVFWTSSAHGKQFSQFHATVIASRDEQDDAELAKKELLRPPMWRSDERPVIGNEDLPPPDQKDLELE
ncbi:MAG: replication/maintenance protein RepL [Moraxellaceae bacterium]|nr:replication/maintenance protein RepL [Moraxellaceae bacterium]